LSITTDQQRYISLTRGIYGLMRSSIKVTGVTFDALAMDCGPPESVKGEATGEPVCQLPQRGGILIASLTRLAP
jgi:hypothetical protein